ncbi:TetR/AcrR family transcriptional regulator [Streptomyces chiangmaiensis]|uniref:TetR/AcrR family transcriptional regulator n=1 Tax=Streptomyces chiangmaiensis TaxID=766497 RepID=UPI0036281B88
MGCQAQSGYRPKRETHDRSSGAPQAHRQGTGNAARILEHAAELIYTKGVHATNNEQLRRAAGVSGTQLNHYFPTKETLVLAVIARQSTASSPCTAASNSPASTTSTRFGSGRISTSATSAPTGRLQPRLPGERDHQDGP